MPACDCFLFSTSPCEDVCISVQLCTVYSVDVLWLPAQEKDSKIIQRVITSHVIFPSVYKMIFDMQHSLMCTK